MPLWDTLASAAVKYGPQIAAAVGKMGTGSPMYPGGPSGFTSATVGGLPGAVRRRGRRGRGLSASDIRGAQKVARLVRVFGYKSKIKAKRRR